MPETEKTNLEDLNPELAASIQSATEETGAQETQETEAPKNAILDADPLKEEAAKGEAPKEEPAKSEINWTEHFGDEYSEPTKIKEAIEKSKRYNPELEKEVDLLKKTKQELQQDLETYKQFEVTDENLFRLNKIKKDDPAKFDLFSKLIYGGLSPQDILKTSLKQKRPTLDADEYLQTKYNDLLSEDADPESIEYKRAKQQLDIDAFDASAEMLKEFNGIEIPKTLSSDEREKLITQKEADKAKAEMDLATSWQPSFQKLRKDKIKIDVKIKDKETGVDKTFMEIADIPDDMFQKTLGGVANYVLDNKMQMNPEADQIVSGMVRDTYILQNFPSIVSSIVEKTLADKEAGLVKDIYNPSKETNNDVPDKDTKNLSPEGELEAHMDKLHGIK